MKKKLENRVLKVLGKASVLVAKRTVVSTTRFYSYQPVEDLMVYERMRQLEILESEGSEKII